MVAVIPTRKNKATKNMNMVVLSTLFTKFEAPENIYNILAVNEIQHGYYNHKHYQGKNDTYKYD